MSVAARAALVLGAAVMGALLLLGTVQSLTRERIAQTRQAWLMDNLAALLPDGPFDQRPVDIAWQHVQSELGSDEPLMVYPVFQRGQPHAVVLEVVAPRGYSGEIRLLLGLQVDGQIIAVRTLEHRETPGLGDAIEYRKSSWITQFNDLSLSLTNPADWQTKAHGGRIDAITGATITSRAVTQAVHRALRWYGSHRDEVFSR